MLLLNVLFWCSLVAGVFAKTHEYHFEATYVNASPDGIKERRVVGINNEWPIPTIRVTKGDRVVIHYTNGLQDRNSSLHFHGLFQHHTNSMDGPEYVTQCPIAPGQGFLYNFTVEDQAGTYWYHSHSGTQYGDGLRGLFIIEEKEKSDYPFEFDEEVSLSVSDWYHAEGPELMKKFLSRYNPTGAEPVPQNSLFNDTRNVTWDVKPDTTYFVRVVNMGLFVSQYLKLEGHSFTIVEVDGVYVEPQETDSLYLSVAQRVGILLHTKSTANENYRFLNILDEDMLDLLPEDLQLVSTNWVRYNDYKPLPEVFPIGYHHYEKLIESLKPFDDFKLNPFDKEEALPEPDHKVELNFVMDNLGDGVNYAFFNDISYVAPKVPTLLTVLSSGDLATNEKIYGSNTNSFVLQHNDIIEIVLNNMDDGKHPFHLHGHTFQVLFRSEGDDDEPEVYDPENPDHNKFAKHPVVRDTVMVNPNGFIVLRFKANNPGVWLFHCHVDWHLEQGLSVTFIEAPLEIQNSELPLPKSHFDACEALNMSSKGNAAGNYGELHQEWLDLTGEPLQYPPLPEGFTAKGYLALFMCIVAALYGVLSIYKYGMEDVNSEENEALLQKLYTILKDNDALDENEESTMFTLNSNGERVER